MKKFQSIPESSLKRLPKYLTILRAFKKRQREFITNEHLASVVGFKTEIIREDLEIVDSWTSNSNIHNINYLITKTESYLGFHNDEEAFLITNKVKNIKELIHHFTQTGIKIIAIFLHEIEEDIHQFEQIKIFPIKKLQQLSQRMHIRSAVIKTEDGQAQDLTNMLNDYGFTKLYNCSDFDVITPETIQQVICKMG